MYNLSLKRTNNTINKIWLTLAEKDLIIYNLKTLKALEGLTAEEMADKINVKKHNMIKYLNRSIPPPEVVRSISKVFNLDIHQLFSKKLSANNYQEFKLVAEGGKRVNLPIDDIEEMLSYIKDDTQPEEKRLQRIREVTQMFSNLKIEVEELRTVCKTMTEYLKSNQIIKDL